MNVIEGKLCNENLQKKRHLLKKKCLKCMHPEGIEPPSQEPESYVISTTLRAQARLLV